MTRRARIEGVLLGTAVGDALGLPLEGLSAKAIARRFTPIDRYQLLGRTGFVSDDTEQSALVAQSLDAHPRDVEACARRFRRSLLGWFLRLPWGIGLATLRACGRIALGLRRSGVNSAGNGAAMRAAVVGAVLDDRETRWRFSDALARVTHVDARAVEGARYVAEVVAELCAREGAPGENATGAVDARGARVLDAARTEREAAQVLDAAQTERAATPVVDAARTERAATPVVDDAWTERAAPALDSARAERGALEAALVAVENAELLGALRAALALADANADVAAAAAQLKTTGYVVHTVPFAAYCFARFGGAPLVALQQAFSVGGDTDSIGAIVGAWCGARHGPTAFPAELIGALHDGPFGPTHLRALAADLEAGLAPRARYSWAGAMLRNLALCPVVLAHGFRRLFP